MMLCLFVLLPTEAWAYLAPTPAQAVRALLNQPEARLDFLEASVAFGRKEGSRAHTPPSNRNVTHFSRGPFGIMQPGPLSWGWIIGHDGLHTAGLNDQRGPNGELAYKGAYPENTKALMDIRGTDKAAINPDSLLDW